jgi:hypothetical protein
MKKDGKKTLDSKIDSFLDENQPEQEMDCSSGTCVIKNDKSLVERINKKIITEDGRELLM